MKRAAIIVLASATLAVAEPPKVFINGREIQADVIEKDGRLYVPVEAVGQALGVSVSVQSNEVRLATPTLPGAEPIHGRLTWTAGMFKGNLPDFGAKVWLVRDDEVAGLAKEAGGSASEPIPTGATAWPAKLDRMFPVTVADGNGRFAFTDIAPRNYLLIYLSKRTNGLAARDCAGKIRFKQITVAAGQPVDASCDFGVTAY